MSDNGKVLSAPYVSFRTFLNLLDRLQSGGIPQHMDRHYWGSFLSGSLGPQVMATLRFLGLIDPNSSEPTADLERLVAPEARKTVLAEILRDRYSAIWDAGINLERTTQGHLEAAIGREYKLDGDTRRKATTFFVHAAKFAEIPLSSQVTTNSRPRRSSSTSTGRSKSKGRQAPSLPNEINEPSSRTGKQESVIPSNEPYAILHAWLKQLPSEGRWTAERRDRWLAALQANVDFLVTVENDDYDEYEEDEDEE